MQFFFPFWSVNKSHCTDCLACCVFPAQMEEGYELDLTYVTERIIAVSFPQACSEETYLHNLKDVTRMLKSKHADNYLVRHAQVFPPTSSSEMTCWKKQLRITGPGGMSFSLSSEHHAVCRASWFQSRPLEITAINALDGFLILTNRDLCWRQQSGLLNNKIKRVFAKMFPVTVDFVLVLSLAFSLAL